MPEEFRCEFPLSNPTNKEIRSLLTSAKKIAVVGISPKEERPSHWIAKYLMDRGYQIFGVNPGISEFAGQPVYKSLDEVPEAVDIVDIFRQPEHVPEIVEQAIQKKAK